MHTFIIRLKPPKDPVVLMIKGQIHPRVLGPAVVHSSAELCMEGKAEQQSGSLQGWNGEEVAAVVGGSRCWSRGHAQRPKQRPCPLLRLVLCLIKSAKCSQGMRPKNSAAKICRKCSILLSTSDRRILEFASLPGRLAVLAANPGRAQNV